MTCTWSNGSTSVFIYIALSMRLRSAASSQSFAIGAVLLPLPHVYTRAHAVMQWTMISGSMLLHTANTLAPACTICTKAHLLTMAAPQLLARDECLSLSSAVALVRGQSLCIMQ